jgi:hypothetical protein
MIMPKPSAKAEENENGFEPHPHTEYPDGPIGKSAELENEKEE